jgi:hypothetical protein
MEGPFSFRLRAPNLAHPKQENAEKEVVVDFL